MKTRDMIFIIVFLLLVILGFLAGSKPTPQESKELALEKRYASIDVSMKNGVPSKSLIWIIYKETGIPQHKSATLLAALAEDYEKIHGTWPVFQYNGQEYLSNHFVKWSSNRVAELTP